MTQAQKMKELLTRKEVAMCVGAYDGYTARLVQEAGFESILMTGYGVSGSVLGMPDYGMMTMTEMCTRCKDMVNVVDIPILADGDTGYGNPLNVRRTVMEYERAGAAAIQLEDQIFPKRCGHMDGKEVIPTLEHCRKIEMAVETRKEMLVLARSDARAPYGIDEAIRRVNEYAKAGADFVIIDAPGDVDELKKIADGIKVPIMVNQVEGGKTPILPKKTLEEMGFSLICYPTFVLFAAVKCLREMLADLQAKGDSNGVKDRLETFKSYTELVGLPELQRLEQKYVLDDKK